MKTLTRQEAAPLIKSGAIRPAFLYESGRRVKVQLSKSLTRVYIYVKKPRTPNAQADEPRED